MTAMDAESVDVLRADDSMDGVVVSKTVEDMNYFGKYVMTHKKRGVAYIFNIEKFKDKDPDATRHGSSRDTNAFKTALIYLGFDENDIIVYKNRTAEQMRNILNAFQEDNPGIDRNIDCFVCAIMSHGKENDIICGSDGEIELDELLSCLKPDRCPSLRGIPKLIFIQACRGSMPDAGCEPNGNSRHEIEENPPIEEKPPKVPIIGDMLVFHSSHHKYYSVRDEGEGSWFMQSLSEILKRYGTEHDILKLLTAVCNHIASKRAEILIEDNSNKDNSHKDNSDKRYLCIETKQMPQILSTLCKELKFERRM